MADVGSLNSLAAEKAASQQVRTKAVDPAADRPRAETERAPRGSDGVALSDNAAAELRETREKEDPVSPRHEEAPKERARQEDPKAKDRAAEELRLELAKPKKEQDQELVQRLQGELQGEPAEGEQATGQTTPLSGEVFGRPVDPNDAHDMFWRWQQESGRPAPRNADEAREAFKDLAAFGKKHGFQVDVVEHERLDKLVITRPDGRRVQADVVANMGGAPGEQKWWFGDVVDKGAAPAAEGSYTPMSGTVHGRPADPNDSNDMFWLWLQKSGRPAPRNSQEAREAYEDLAAFAQEHGFKVEVVEHERLDKLVITNPEGKITKADVVGNMGGAPGEQRWWFGDITNPEPPAAATNALQGFDWGQLSNLSNQSPMYQFGRAASFYDPGGVQTDQQAQALLDQMILAMQGQGLQVVAVDGTRIQVKTGSGYEWVDVLQSYQGGGAHFQWAPQGSTMPFPTRYAPTA